MQLQRFGTRTRSAENLYFRTHDEDLIEELKWLERMRQAEGALRRASGIRNHDVLRALIQRNISPQNVGALAFVPLVEVAWADGRVESPERQVLSNAMHDCGITSVSTEHDTIDRWMSHEPPTEIAEAWSQYMRGLCERLSPYERRMLRDAILQGVHRMAQAHAGLLGFVDARAWKKEEETIARIEWAFLNSEHVV